MTNPQARDPAQQKDVTTPAPGQVEQNGPPLPKVAADIDPADTRGARISLLVWLAVFLFLATLLVWDLVAAVFFG